MLARIYASELETQAWLEGIRREAERTFEGHAGAQAYLVRVEDDRAEVEAAAACEPAISRDERSRRGALSADGVVLDASGDAEPRSARSG